MAAVPAPIVWIRLTLPYTSWSCRFPHSFAFYPQYRHKVWAGLIINTVVLNISVFIFLTTGTLDVHFFHGPLTFLWFCFVLHYVTQMTFSLVHYMNWFPVSQEQLSPSGCSGKTYWTFWSVTGRLSVFIHIRWELTGKCWYLLPSVCGTPQKTKDTTLVVLLCARPVSSNSKVKRSLWCVVYGGGVATQRHAQACSLRLSDFLFYTINLHSEESPTLGNPSQKESRRVRQEESDCSSDKWVCDFVECCGCFRGTELSSSRCQDTELYWKWSCNFITEISVCFFLSIRLTGRKQTAQVRNTQQ